MDWACLIEISNSLPFLSQIFSKTKSYKLLFCNVGLAPNENLIWIILGVLNCKVHVLLNHLTVYDDF